MSLINKLQLCFTLFQSHMREVGVRSRCNLTYHSGRSALGALPPSIASVCSKGSADSPRSSTADAITPVAVVPFNAAMPRNSLTDLLPGSWHFMDPSGVIEGLNCGFVASFALDPAITGGGVGVALCNSAGQSQEPPARLLSYFSHGVPESRAQEGRLGQLLAG